jgi:hypothetical protein
VERRSFAFGLFHDGNKTGEKEVIDEREILKKGGLA